MNNKTLDIVTHLIPIGLNIGLGLLLNIIFFEDISNIFIMLTGGVILLSTIIVNMIAQKLGYKLDLYAHNIEQVSYRILNNIFVANILSIPITILVTILI